MTIPSRSPYVVVGAGIHGLSTAYHLAKELRTGNLVATYERQERIGYRSELIVGEAAVDAHMKALFPDWRARGVTVCLHEKQGGFAFNMASVIGLVGKCESEGVTIISGVEVQELESGSDGAVRAVETDKGRIEVGEQLVLAPGPWAKQLWA